MAGVTKVSAENRRSAHREKSNRGHRMQPECAKHPSRRSAEIAALELDARQVKREIAPRPREGGFRDVRMALADAREQQLVGTLHRLQLGRDALLVAPVRNQNLRHDDHFVVLEEAQVQIPVLTSLAVGEAKLSAVASGADERLATDQWNARAAD